MTKILRYCILSRHGDMIYLVPQRTFRKSIISKCDQEPLDDFHETKDDDDVDAQLDKIDGRIAREPNPQLSDQTDRSRFLIDSFL